MDSAGHDLGLNQSQLIFPNTSSAGIGANLICTAAFPSNVVDLREYPSGSAVIHHENVFQSFTEYTVLTIIGMAIKIMEMMIFSDTTEMTLKHFPALLAAVATGRLSHRT